MKNSLLLLSAFLFNLHAVATVRTVSNDASKPAQYNNLQAAIDAAATNDTIYVLGTGTAYGNIAIDKKLTVIGSGYAPPAPALSTDLGTVYLTINSTGSQLQGLNLTNYLYLNSNNITVERCNISTISAQSNGLSNLVFRHNYIITYVMGYPLSVLFANNIIHSGGYIYGSNSGSVVITNNLFMGNANYAFFSVSNALITNNIFWQSTPVYDATGCTFNNNITYQTNNNTIPYGSNSGTGNLVGANPLFTNAPNNTVNYTYNYDLLPASTGNNAGMDGTDIGLYGGPAPWPNQTGLARIPFMQSFNLQLTQVPQGGTVNGTVKAKKIN